jgi:hypothetical protein
MPRRRPFAAIAAFALLGALALTGCGKAQPGTAAYVGDTRYTERQLDILVDEIRRVPSEAQPPDPRGWALARLILGDIARRVTTERNISVPAAEYDESAQRLGLPADSPLVRLRADFDAVAGALVAQVQPIPATEDDYREIWDALRRDPRLIPGTTYEQVVDALRNDTSVPLALGVRQVLREEAAKTRIVVNPVYRPLIVNIGIGDAPLPLLLGEDAGFVADLVSSGG